MPIKIDYSKIPICFHRILFFSNDEFNNKILRALSNTELSYINDLLKSSDLKKIFLIYELIPRKKLY